MIQLATFCQIWLLGFALSNIELILSKMIKFKCMLLY